MPWAATQEDEVASAVVAWHNGLQPLHLAAKNGHTETARYLLGGGSGAAAAAAVPVNTAGDSQKWTPLHWATQRGELSSSRDSFSSRSKIVVTHLGAAATSPELWADGLVNPSDNLLASWHGMSPLHWAIQRGASYVRCVCS